MKVPAQLAQEELQKAQGEQKRRYDGRVKPHSFEVGQKALLLFPSSINVASTVAELL